MASTWFDTTTTTAAPADSFEAGARYDTVIAGAGITGMATAVLLARAGQRVAVIEARHLGAVTTGHTTGKVSLLQGATLSQIRRFHSAEVVAAYVAANQAGQEWLLDYLDHREVPYQRRTAYTYATTSTGLARLEAEHQQAREAGLPVTWTQDLGLPFATIGAIQLEDQAQINAVDVLHALSRELRELGGARVEEVRLTDASSGSQLTLQTTAGELYADRLVLATGIPVLDRGGYFAKVSANRSYAMTFKAADPQHLPTGMFLSVDSPTRTLRTVPHEDGDRLLVGGNGHVVGRSSSPAEAVADLEAWARDTFDLRGLTHSWSAQDYESVNRVPFVGALPRGGGKIFVATGYNKWGLTNGIAAAIALSGDILDRAPAWHSKLSHRITKPTGLVEAADINARVGLRLGMGWLGAEVAPLPKDPPAEGEGRVGRSGVRPVAVSTVDGQTCRLSAICTHLGGVLRWNDAEHSWDCPLHGSRFAADGTLLEGPATEDLRPAT